MGIVNYKIDTGQPPFTIQVTPGNLCTDNCNHTLVNTSTSSVYDDSGLTKGIGYTLSLKVTDNFGCINAVSFNHCCATTGGDVSGSLNPVHNSIVTYNLSGVIGSASLAWELVGGNASIVSTTGNQVTVNAGTLPFIVSAKLTDCTGPNPRFVSLVVTPSPSCTMTVSTPIFTC